MFIVLSYFTGRRKLQKVVCDMNLEEIVKLILDIGPGEYGRYNIKREDDYSYFDILIEDDDENSLVMQFSVDKESGDVWDIEITDFRSLKEFIKYLDCIKLYKAMERRRFIVEINQFGRIDIYNDALDFLIAIQCGNDSYIIDWNGGSCLVPKNIDMDDIAELIWNIYRRLRG